MQAIKAVHIESQPEDVHEPVVDDCNNCEKEATLQPETANHHVHHYLYQNNNLDCKSEWQAQTFSFSLNKNTNSSNNKNDDDVVEQKNHHHRLDDAQDFATKVANFVNKTAFLPKTQKLDFQIGKTD